MDEGPARLEAGCPPEGKWRPRIFSSWFPLIVIGAGLLLSCEQGPDERAAQAEATAKRAVAHHVRCAILPTGLELEFDERSAERQLIDLLNDPAVLPHQMPWMRLDAESIESGDSAAPPVLQAQLANIASILRTYPEVRIKIAGVVRGAPTPQENVRASLHLAIAVLSRLSKLGVDPERMGAHGLGDREPAPELGEKAERQVLVQVAAR